MEEDLKLWKRNARKYQQSCCNSLADRTYDRVTEDHLERKIGYALYNVPTEIDKVNKTAVYTKAQQNHITLMCNKLKSLQPNEEGLFYISYVYIVIRLRKNKNDEAVQVIFRVPRFLDGKPNFDSNFFLDPKPRIYETWNDYLKKNKLPKCDMCYPSNGFYSAVEGSVDIQFGTSPACDKSTAVFTGLDVSSTVLLVGATGVSLASLAVPIATPFIWGATATIFASGTYETARTAYRLHDLKTHGESLGLKNPDSRSAWLNLAGTVVGMASVGTTAVAKSVIATESAISRAGILTLRVLNCSSLAVSGIGIANNIITLVMKRINGELEIGDILKFVSCCFFFLNAIVGYKLAENLIAELASSDLTNLFNLRVNTMYHFVKDVIELNDSTTYNILRELVLGCRSAFYPNITTDYLNSVVCNIVELLWKISAGKINKLEFTTEMIKMLSEIWKKYENIILNAIKEIKNAFELSDWQQLLPKQISTNLEVPRQMCDETNRVLNSCSINDTERPNLMTFARAFSISRGSSTDQEFINRFKFYCDSIIAQFREEKENYENELDARCSHKDLKESYCNKNEVFFNKALAAINHPDILGNMDELYDRLPRTEENITGIPYFHTTKSAIYTFCGPLNIKELNDSHYWAKAVELTGFQVGKKNSTITMKDNLVVIQPDNEIEKDLKLSSLETIVIYSSFVIDCHMGFLVVILN